MTMTKISDFILLFFYCLFIYWLSDQASLPVPQMFTVQDKILHFGAYFIMGLLAWRSFKFVFKQPSILALLSISFCSLYGITDEWHQYYVEGRMSDVIDWLADTGGAGFAVYCLHKLGW